MFVTMIQGRFFKDIFYATVRCDDHLSLVVSRLKKTHFGSIFQIFVSQTEILNLFPLILQKKLIGFPNPIIQLMRKTGQSPNCGAVEKSVLLLRS